MKISWLGHACFLFEVGRGVKIITDPYEPGSFGGTVRYSAIDIQPDIVTVSHQHADHNYTQGFTKAKVIIKEGKFKTDEVEIEGISSFHDKNKGASRGKNTIFIINAEGLNTVHFGDLGTLDILYSKLLKTDIALVPVGGKFTIDGKEATQLIEKINPKIVIPMHFKTPKLGFDIDGVDGFLEGKDYERRQSLEVNLSNINSFKKIVVLAYQR